MSRQLSRKQFLRLGAAAAAGAVVWPASGGTAAWAADAAGGGASDGADVWSDVGPPRN